MCVLRVIDCIGEDIRLHAKKACKKNCGSARPIPIKAQDLSLQLLCGDADMWYTLLMEDKVLEYFCQCIAKSSGFPVRVYRDGTAIFTAGLRSLKVDPLLPFEAEALAMPCGAGGNVYVNDVLQLYGCLGLYEDSLRLVIGPTALHTWNKDTVDGFLHRFALSEADESQFCEALKKLPRMTYEKMIWLLRMFDVSINGRISSDDDPLAPFERSKKQVGRLNADVAFQEETEDANQINKDSTYDYEKQIISFIKSGRPEKLKDLFTATLNIQSGRMAKDMLRQTRNMFICGTTLASRAAVDGGLDSTTAFRLSDIYIQKIEMIDDPNVIMQLIYEMMIDYAERTKQAAFSGGSGSMLMKKCSRYVLNHITESLRVGDVAEHLNISPAYLCTAFKQQSGMTLNAFITQKKIEEAVRLLEFSDKSISEIAEHLSFCSQSHFQNAFKKVTGRTPRSFRA